MMANDTGCSYHNDCLSCPLPECNYVTRDYTAASLRKLRIIDLAKTMSVSEIARELNVSIRTVQRALKEYQHE